MFLGVLGIWLWSARPTLYNFGHWVAPDRIPDWYSYKASLGEVVGEPDHGVPTATPEGVGYGIQDVFISTPEPIQIEIIQPDPVIIQIEPEIQPTPTGGFLPANPPSTDGSSQFQGKASQFCGNCDGYSVKIKYTHYYPPEGGINCWDWNEDTQYCDSPTYSGIPWESALYWGAACPYDWGIGTWIEVPYWGSVMCIDRGSMECVLGTDGWLCHVDILAPSIGVIDGQVIESEVYIP